MGAFRRLLGLGECPAATTVPTDFETRHHNVELALALNLPFQSVKQITLEFLDLAAAQAGHVEMIALGTALVEVLLPLHMHEIEFIHQAMAFEQAQGSIDRNAVDAGVNLSCFAKQLTGVEVSSCCLNDLKNSAALPGHAQAT
jgi:hypothetical protein